MSANDASVFSDILDAELDEISESRGRRESLLPVDNLFGAAKLH